MILLSALFIALSSGLTVFSNSTSASLSLSKKCKPCRYYDDDGELQPTYQINGQTMCTNRTSAITIALLQTIPKSIAFVTYHVTVELSHTLDPYALPTSLEFLLDQSEPIRHVFEGNFYFDYCADCYDRYDFAYTPFYGEVARNMVVRAVGNVVCFHRIQVEQFITIQQPEINSFTPKFGPIEGNTEIDIIGERFYDDDQYHYIR